MPFLWILPLLATVGIGYYEWSTPRAEFFLLDHVAYYLMLALFFVVLYVYRFEWEESGISIRKFFKKYRSAVIVALLFTLFVSLTVPIGFKVLSDEAIYIGISRTMHHHQATYLTYGERWAMHDFLPFMTEHAKRPLVFPFLVHLLHWATGYRMLNAFAVNTVALFVLLLILFIVCQKITDSLTALAAVFLILAQPIVPLNAMSAGADLVSSLFLVICLLCLHRYLKEPSSDALLLLWVNSLILVHTRYECLVYVIIFTAVIILSRQFRFSHVKAHSFLYSTTPIFFLPWIWQRLIKHDLSSIQFNPEGKPFQAYGFIYLERHLKEIFSTAWEMRGFIPFSPLLIGLGIVALIYLIIKVPRSERMISLAVFTCLLVNLFVFFSFSGGSVIRPSAARYFLNTCLLLSLCPVFLKRFFRIPSAVFVGVAVLLFFLGFPKAMKNESMGSLVEVRATAAIADYLKHYEKDKVLLVCDRPHHFTIDNYSAVPFQYVNQKPTQIIRDLREHSFSEILVAQRVDSASGNLQQDQAFPAPFNLKTLSEVEISPWEKVRFSSVQYAN